MGGGATELELLLLGTGVSTGVPQIACVLPSCTCDCAVCKEALGDARSPNRRCNVSALVRVGGRTVLIDCGKTIREAALRHFPTLGVGGVDAIVLTHGHAHAMYGLVDMRDIQRHHTGSTAVFLNQHTYIVCRKVFPYLVPTDGDKKEDVARCVASLTWHVQRAHSSASRRWAPTPTCSSTRCR